MNMIFGILDIEEENILESSKLFLTALWPFLIVFIPLQFFALIFSAAYKIATS